MEGQPKKEEQEEEEEEREEPFPVVAVDAPLLPLASRSASSSLRLTASGSLGSNRVLQQTPLHATSRRRWQESDARASSRGERLSSGRTSANSATSDSGDNVDVDASPSPSSLPPSSFSSFGTASCSRESLVARSVASGRAVPSPAASARREIRLLGRERADIFFPFLERIGTAAATPIFFFDDEVFCFFRL